MRRLLLVVGALLILSRPASADDEAGRDPFAAVPETPRFSRHAIAVFSRAGCNNGTCHGAVQGKNGFRLSLFGARPDLDHEQIVRSGESRRVNPLEPEQSLFLLKGAALIPHGGGRAIHPRSPEYELLRRWVIQGADFDDVDASRLKALIVEPRERTVLPGEEYRLTVTAQFADGTSEDVTALSSFESRDEGIATVDRDGLVRAQNVGDVAVVVRFRSEPAMAMVLVPRPPGDPFPQVAAHNFIDEHVLAKLRRLNIPPSGLADDATFLRRARLDVTGKLPTPDEVREFLTDSSPDKRTRKIEQLLAEPGYAALWTLKLCDLLRASDFGIYADGLAEHYEAPRFQAWVRARVEENTPWDEFAARVLAASSRDGRPLEEWAKEVVALQEGYGTPRSDLALYANRKTLDIYWQRKGAIGVSGALQVAHAFLGLRLECAQCHRHPHDVWQQDDLLSFANFFTRVRTVGFQGDNEKKYPEDAALFKKYTEEGKALNEQAKKLKEGGSKDPAVQAEIRELERRGRILSDDVPKRILHAQIFHRTDDAAAKTSASVTSPLGTQSSSQFRLLGQTEPLEIPPDEDPRGRLVEWLRRPDNPYFARAIVNRVWTHYFGRGLTDPPDDLSPLNPATHPELLDELCRRFIASGYDLKWLHRAILASRTYQQSSQVVPGNETDRANYARFALRRIPAEVLVDALNQTTGTREDPDMKYWNWPDYASTVEFPYTSRNGFVTFLLEQFGRPARNSSVQCDCERQADASMLQVLSLANHPRLWQKIADPKGRVAELAKSTPDPDRQIDELYLATLGRSPDESELATCRRHIAESESPEAALRAILWGLLNTREFLLQH